MTHHRKWFGNENVQDMLAGPFFGFRAPGPNAIASAIVIDHTIRMWGQFSMRYFEQYIICSGPLIGDALNAALTPAEQEVVTKWNYSGETLADCISALFVGEKLQLSYGYAVRAREGRVVDGEGHNG